MHLHRPLCSIIGVLIGLLTSASCVPSVLLIPHATTLVSLPTLLPLTPTSVQPTSTSSPPIPTLALTHTPILETWDLVVMSDSSLIGVGQVYASYIEEDLGVEVELHDLWRGGFRAVDLLYRLQNWEDWRAIVSEAEVVVYFGNPLGSATGDWQCIDPEYSVRDCSPETFEGYRVTLEEIAAEILDLRDGSPTILRATDFYSPINSQWREASIFSECMQCFVNMNEAVHQAAAAKDVPVAGVFTAFNGPDHDEDPREKGYIGSDGIHTNAAGQEVIAGLLRALGYEPIY